ncbi:hypothetical protein AB0J43_02035 [Nonomuraea fuscirosea]
MATTTPTTIDTTSNGATPVQIGEQLVQLLHAANGCTAQVVARDPGVFGHLCAALLELLRTQGWEPRQAEEAVTAVTLDPNATLQETMRRIQETAQQVHVAACTQLGINPDSDHGPQLLPEWDDPERQWVVTWPGVEWTSTFPHGGFNADGIEFPEAILPAGVWVEQINDYSITVNAR